jgi:hypothetical protein
MAREYQLETHRGMAAEVAVALVATGVALKLYEVVRITIGAGIALHPAYALQGKRCRPCAIPSGTNVGGSGCPAGSAFFCSHAILLLRLSAIQLRCSPPSKLSSVGAGEWQDLAAAGAA